MRSESNPARTGRPRVKDRSSANLFGPDVRRREVLALLGAVAGAIMGPLAADAQQGARIRRVGILFPAGETPGFGQFTRAMTELGYVEGRDVVYIVRAAGREPERYGELARELVAAQPDVIVTATAQAGVRLTEATR